MKIKIEYIINFVKKVDNVKILILFFIIIRIRYCFK